MIPASPVGSVSSPATASPVRRQGLGWRVALGTALMGLGSLGLAIGPWATSTVLAQEPCQGNAALCCQGQSVQGAIPNLSASFAQEVCTILTMPTASRSEGEAFLQHIEFDSLLTQASASAETMTLPSMWWTRDSIPSQLGRHRLVDSWLSYRMREAEVQVVDVMINSQFWRALTMPQRYGVLTQFGTSAQEFGYHLRFFHNNGYSARMIGIFSCEAPDAASALAAAPTAHCLVTVDTPRINQLQQAVRPQSAIQTATEPAPAVALDVAEGATKPRP